MKTKLIVVGKIKEPFLIQGINEYLKRLSKYCELEIVEIKEESIKENAHDKDIEIALKKEGDAILKVIDNKDFVFLLDVYGKELDSVEFATFYNEKINQNPNHVVFVLGSSYGFSTSVKDRANFRFSLSKCTFTHQMTRMILLEQIYRAYKINNKEVYHK